MDACLLVSFRLIPEEWWWWRRRKRRKRKWERRNAGGAWGHGVYEGNIGEVDAPLSVTRSAATRRAEGLGAPRPQCAANRRLLADHAPRQPTVGSAPKPEPVRCATPEVRA